MPGLSIGAYVAWQYAAGEAAEAGHPYIEARHVLLGVLSLEKALNEREAADLRWSEREELRVEAELVRRVMSLLGVEVAEVRRAVRAKLLKGSHFHAGDVVHRSPRARALFAQAQTLAGQERVLNALHLLAVLAGDSQDGMAYLLREVGIMPGELAEIVRSNLSFAESGVQSKRDQASQGRGRGGRSKARSK